MGASILGKAFRLIQSRCGSGLNRKETGAYKGSKIWRMADTSEEAGSMETCSFPGSPQGDRPEGKAHHKTSQLPRGGPLHVHKRIAEMQRMSS